MHGWWSVVVKGIWGYRGRWGMRIDRIPDEVYAEKNDGGAGRSSRVEWRW